MTPAKPKDPTTRARTPREAPPARLTTDDLRHKALAVRDVATGEARRIVQTNRVRIIIGAAVVGAVALSVAYYLGSRAGRAQARARRR